MKITELSLKKPVSLIVLILSVYVLGIMSLFTLPVNLLPDIVYPLVKVNISWRGATAEDIENQIADIVEQKVSTVDDLDYISSTCMEGMYELLVNFDFNADRDVAYQDVVAKMGIVRKNLPKDADEPVIIKADPSQLPVMDLLVTSENWDLVKLRTWVENYLNLLFVSVPGSAGTDVSGGMKREIRVYADPYKMQAKNVSADMLIRRLKDENIELSGGRVITGRKEFLVRTKAEFLNIEEIKNTIITTDKYGKTVYVKDVALVKDTGDIQRVKTKLNSKEGVKLSIFKQVVANTLDVESAIRQRIKEIQPLLPAGVKISEIYTQGSYIRAANKGVRDAALIAALLVVLITWFFLGTWKRTLVIALSMPLPMLVTFFAMRLMDFSFNIFSLGGLILAITVILDQSVIVLENITRHQEDEAASGTERMATDVLIALASNEVSRALLFAVMTFVAIFLPFLLVPGLATLLFHELIVIVAVAIASSMLVAITATPMLSKLLHEKSHFESKKPLGEELLERLKEKYRRTLVRALKRRKGIMWLTALLFALGLFSFMKVGREFLPKADDGQITVKVKMPSGSSMQETEKALLNIEKKVKTLPFVERTFSLAGGRIWGLVTYEIANEGQVDIYLVPRGKRDITTDEYIAKYAAELNQSAQYPGAKVKVFHTKMKGIRQEGDYDIEVELYAPKTLDINELYGLATKTLGKIKDTEGITALDVSIEVSKPEYQLILNRAKAIATGSSLGITVIIGILILSGIEIVHGVVLLTFIQELMAKGLPLEEAVMEGATLRMRPILMTAFVGIMGMVPLALGIGEGTELLKPMAIAVIGGLLFSMYLTFYFMPSAFMIISKRK